MSAPPEHTDAGTDGLTHLLGPARWREVRRIVMRLLTAWAIAVGPLYLVAVRVDGWKDLGGLAVLTALLVGLPSYLVLVATPTAWRTRVGKAGLPWAGAGIGLGEAYRPDDAWETCATAYDLGLLPDHTNRNLGASLAGTLHSVPARLFDVTLKQTGGRVVFRGLLIRFDLPRATGTTATVHPTPGPVRRTLNRLGTRLSGRPPKSAVRGKIYTVQSDAPRSAAAWITPAVLVALADLGRAEGRRLDTTTVASIVAGLLTPDMEAKAVTAGLRDDAFYLAVDRRAPFIRAPHPFTAPKSPEALLQRWERRAGQALEPLSDLLETEPFRA